MNVAARVLGATTLRGVLDRMPAQVEKRLDGVVLTHSQLLLTKIRANASGRPGPNAPTGDYRRSWTVQKTGRGEYTTGTNAPQGRRLEFGFTGVDSLGRNYDQPPYPHVQPATDAIWPKFTAACDRAVAGVIS